VNAFAAGGVLPKEVLGTKQEGMIAAWDWYATFARLAGVKDVTDHRALAVGLPDVDSIDVWPLLSGQTKVSPRHELAIGDADDPPNPPVSLGGVSGNTVVGGLIRGQFKVVRGNISQAGWTGPVFPSKSGHYNPSSDYQYCGTTVSTGCMYDIYLDPNEETNIVEFYPELFQQMQDRMNEIQKGVLSPLRGTVDPAACDAAMNSYGGFWGPWLNTTFKLSSDLSLLI
jgi:arylsulfatase I/J